MDYISKDNAVEYVLDNFYEQVRDYVLEKEGENN